MPTRLDRSFSAALPSVSARATLLPGWSLYAQAARGFLAPPLQLFDVSDPAAASPAPQSTWNFQLGSNWHGGTTTIAVDLYEILFSNAIGVRTIGGESLDFDEGRVTYRGLEAEGSQVVGHGLSAFASASLNRATQHDGGDQPAPDTPQATASAGLVLQRAWGSVSVIDRWTGGSYGDVDRSNWIAPYSQLDLSAATVLHPRRNTPVALKLQLFNLADSRKIDGFAGYTVAAATPLFWCQPGRSVFVSAGTTF